MRTLPPLLFFLLSCVAALGQAESKVPRIVSPEISADRHVTIRLNAPNAKEVLMKCEFDPGRAEAKKDKEGSWEIPLAKDEQGTWNITVGPIAPEIYHYYFHVDGVRTIDVANPNLKTGSLGATLASSLEVRGDKPAFYDLQAGAHGDVCAVWYRSKSLGTTRRVNVYLPPDYDRDTTRRYPVAYLLHGAQADENVWSRLGRANFIMDNLIAASKSVPFIIVMPFGYAEDPNTPGPHDQNTAKVGRDLIEDLIPFIDGKYRTQPDREHRALFGISMGGGEALNIGLNHLERFAYVGGYSAGIGRPATYPSTYATLLADPDAANRQLKLLWIGCGLDDTTHLGDARALSQLLNEHGIKNTLRETEGGHTWIVWRRYLLETAPLLFR
jgi:enterochelin esterase-like enzyme